MSIFHIGILYAKPEYKETLIDSFEILKLAPGYISSNCYQDTENENKISVIEEWESKESHTNFINSMSEENMKQWLKLLSQEPESSFYTKL